MDTAQGASYDRPDPEEANCVVRSKLPHLISFPFTSIPIRWTIRKSHFHIIHKLTQW